MGSTLRSLPKPSWDSMITDPRLGSREENTPCTWIFLFYWQRTRKGRGSSSQTHLQAELPATNPTHPAPYRDHGGAPLPDPGDEFVSHVNLFLHPSPDLHCHWDIQHLQRWEGEARLDWAPPAQPQALRLTEFIPRTICSNLLERVIRAQPPPWDKTGTSALCSQSGASLQHLQVWRKRILQAKILQSAFPSQIPPAISCSLFPFSLRR